MGRRRLTAKQRARKQRRQEYYEKRFLHQQKLASLPMNIRDNPNLPARPLSHMRIIKPRKPRKRGKVNE